MNFTKIPDIDVGSEKIKDNQLQLAGYKPYIGTHKTNLGYDQSNVDEDLSCALVGNLANVGVCGLSSHFSALKQLEETCQSQGEGQ